jgi:ubiquinone/menaquinone biosynthesis C-methylase UbiE
LSSADSFDRIAGHYHDRLPYLAKFFEECARRMTLDKNARLLDLACGMGELARGFSPYCREIVGVDISEKMLERAHMDAPKNIEFHCADLNEPLPFNLGKFDAVAIGRAVKYLKTPVLLPLQRRHLEKNGLVLVCGTGFVQPTAWIDAYNEFAKTFQDLSRPYSPRWRNHFSNSDFKTIDAFKLTKKSTFTVDDLLAELRSRVVFSELSESDAKKARAQMTEMMRSYFNEDGVLTGDAAS